MSILEQPDTPPGNPDFNTPVPPPVRGGGRNPLALVVVAVVAAAMMYFGFHMARRAGSDNRTLLVGKSSVAPDFSLETIDGKNMRLSDLRGKAVC